MLFRSRISHRTGLRHFLPLRRRPHTKKDGTLMDGLINGNGSTQCPVRKTDAERYRQDITGDNYKYTFFTDFWKPKDDIPMWILDEDVKEVFVVCYKEEKADKKTALEKAAGFMLAYAARL